MKNKSKFLVIASEWFESLSEKNQKAYIAQHPDSKFAHKVGTGNKNPAITKSKNKQMEHLEQEGIDVGINYFGHGSNDASKIGSVADLSGKKSSSRGASAPRALLEDLGSHKSKIKALQDQLEKEEENYKKIMNLLSDTNDRKQIDKILDKADSSKFKSKGIREKLETLKNK